MKSVSNHFRNRKKPSSHSTAVEALHDTRSSITRIIRALEKELAYEVFFRSRHDITLNNTEFNDRLVRELISQITVFSNHFTLEFKAGIMIDIEA